MKNSFVIAGDITIIFLKTILGESYETIIETDDIERVMEFPRTWCAAKREYDSRVTVTGASGLHRWLMNPPNGFHVDHINRNPLDNRRSNLRICTPTENYRNKSTNSNNTSGATGVTRSLSKWKAFIRADGKNKYLGTFENIEDAIIVRREAEIKYFGEFRPMGKDDQVGTKC